MYRFRNVIVTFIVVLAMVVVGARPARGIAAPGAGRIVGYFVEWGIYARNYRVQNVVTSGSAGKLTHLNYAFGNVAPAPDNSGATTCQLADPWADYQKTWAAEESVDGVPVPWGAPLRGNFQQLKQLKAQYPQLKVLISLGGWTLSSHFSDAALTPQSRQAFVKSCVDLFIKGDLPRDADAGGPGSGAGVFDGVDVDWEYPGACGNTCDFRPEDTQNFTALLQELRGQLDAAGRLDGRHYLLTIAASAGPSTFAKLELNKIHTSLDFVNLMAYDFHGPWESTTNFQSPLYPSPDDPSRELHLTTSEAVQAYLTGGVPPDKLVVGVPFYGHGWQGVSPAGNGLYQPSSGPAPGTYEAGSEDFKVLESKLQSGAFTRYFDGKTRNAWLYDPATRVFWTYDDPKSLKEKAKYVEKEGLGGLMFWELSGDDASGSLISSLADRLR